MEARSTTTGELREIRNAWRSFYKSFPELHATVIESEEARRLRLAWKAFNRYLDIRGARCECCGESLIFALTHDHILPVSAGGETVPENLQVLCLSCNQMKGNRQECPHQTIRRIREQIACEMAAWPAGSQKTGTWMP
jgi:5-methylcytosine-specific restriction endonuclease McrA